MKYIYMILNFFREYLNKKTLKEALENDDYDSDSDDEIYEPVPSLTFYFSDNDKIECVLNIGDRDDVDLVNEVIFLYCVLYSEEEFNRLRASVLDSLGDLGKDIDTKIDAVLEISTKLSGERAFENVHFNPNIS